MHLPPWPLLSQGCKVVSQLCCGYYIIVSLKDYLWLSWVCFKQGFYAVYKYMSVSIHLSVQSFACLSDQHFCLF